MKAEEAAKIVLDKPKEKHILLFTEILRAHANEALEQAAKVIGEQRQVLRDIVTDAADRRDVREALADWIERMEVALRTLKE